MVEFKALKKIDLNVTNRCNFHCRHCSLDSGGCKMPELSLKCIERLLIDAKRLGLESIDITGGEPTLRQDLPEIIRLCSSLGLKAKLVTNGSLISEDDIALYRQKGLSSIAVSIDGPDYESHSAIRKCERGAYLRILETIKESACAGLYTKVNTVAFNSGLEGIAGITEQCIKLGATEHRICCFTPIGRGKYSHDMVEPIQWLSFLRNRLMPYSRKIKIKAGAPLIESSLPQECSCLLEAQPSFLHVFPGGEVYPCIMLALQGKAVANIHEKPIAEAWGSTALWEDYLRDAKAATFESKGSICFQGFDFKDYCGNYKLVCPARKFSIQELE